MITDILENEPKQVSLQSAKTVAKELLVWAEVGSDDMKKYDILRNSTLHYLDSYQKKLEEEFLITWQLGISIKQIIKECVCPLTSNKDKFVKDSFRKVIDNIAQRLIR